MTATTRKANNAIQFCGSAIVNVPIGGRKKKLSVSIARSETAIAVLSRASVAAPSTTRRSASAAVVGLTSGSAFSAAVTAPIAPRPPRKTTISRACEMAKHQLTPDSAICT